MTRLRLTRPRRTRPRRTQGIRLSCLLHVACAFCATAAAAQQYIPEKTKADNKAPQGWDGLLTIGSTLSFNSNSNVVGQVDGTATNFGIKLDAALDYRRSRHEWRSRLGYNGSTARTPALPRFVKSADQLLFETIYLLRPLSLPQIGPFVRGVLDTPIFKGHDHRAEPTLYTAPGRGAFSSDRFRLSGAFRPLTLKQSIGAFAKPIEKPAIALEIRLGFGGMQIFADGNFAIDDQDSTPEIDLIALDDSYQAGAEATITASGKASEGRITYSAGFETLIPFINNAADSDDRGLGELTNLEWFAKLSFKLFSWSSLDYEFRAIRKPQLVDAFQVQNNLLLTFSYAFIERTRAEAAAAK